MQFKTEWQAIREMADAWTERVDAEAAHDDVAQCEEPHEPVVVRVYDWAAAE